MPDSRPRPPLLAWDGIVIANADFAAMVAAAVNATSAERREADSLSAAATVALVARASRAHRRSLFDAHARNGQYQSIARASVTTHAPPVVPSIIIDVSPRLVRSDPSIHRSIHPFIHRSSPSIRACVPRPIISRAFARVPREGQWCERSSRTSWSSSSSCVARARAHTRHHASTGAPRSRISRHPRGLVSRFTTRRCAPHTRDARLFDRDRETTPVRGARAGDERV